MKSTLVSYQSLVNARRWDFEYFDPEYQAIIDSIENSGWQVYKLGKIVNSLTDGQHGYLVHLSEGIPLLRTTNIFENEIKLDDVRYIAPEVHSEIKRSQLKPGDVLLTTIGSLGIAAVVDSSLGEANINQNLVKMTPKPEINSLYLSLFLNSNLGKVQTQRTASKSVVPIINYSRLKEIVVPVPPRSLQDQIAQVMQEAYRDRQKKLQQAEQSYQKVIDYVFEQLGINLERTQRKRNALVPISVLQGGRFDFEAVVTVQDISSQFAEHETTLLEEVVEQTNERITPSIDSPDEVVNYIGLANIQSHTGELANFEPVQGKEILSSSPKFAKGDILFGRMRPYLNKVWIAEFDGICSGEALIFRPNKNKVDTQFLHTLLLSQLTLDQVVPLQSGSSLPRVSASDVLSVKLPVPKDLQKQQEIGNEVKKRRSEAKRLRSEAEAVVAAAKARVERMILGEEEIEEN